MKLGLELKVHVYVMSKKKAISRAQTLRQNAGSFIDGNMNDMDYYLLLDIEEEEQTLIAQIRAAVRIRKLQVICMLLFFISLFLELQH